MSKRWLILAVVVLATGLRFFRIEAQSYWNDEGNSRVQAQRSLSDIWLNTIPDIHPPGYYILLSGWRALVGESEFGLRSFSALIGVMLVAGVFRLGIEPQRRKDRQEKFGAVLAAVFVAINPFLIYYSQEARMYSLLATVSVGSWLCFINRSQGRGWMLGYVLLTTLGLYTHYAFGFVLIAQNLVAILQYIWDTAKTKSAISNLKSAITWFALQLLTFLLFLPWLPIALRQLTQWPAAREFHTFIDSFLELIRYLAFGRTLTTNEALFGIAAVGVLLTFNRSADSGWAVLRFTPRLFSFLVWLLVPSMLTLGFGLLSETFSKFLLVAVPPLCLLLGFGIEAIPVRRWMIVGAWILGFGISAFTAASLNNLYFNPAYFRDDYRGIAQAITRVQRSDDAVLLIAPNQAEAFTYYYHTDNLYPIPRTRPLLHNETIADLSAITQAHSRLFVLFWAEGQADPDSVVENWLNANAFKASDQWYGQVRLAIYAAAQPASAPNTLLNARYGDHIMLNGYALNAATYAPGDILQLTLFWQTNIKLDTRYKVFVHLSPSFDEPPIAQHDGEPGGNLRPTTDWQPNTRLADNHGVLIPPDTPPGTYHLIVGVYNLTDGTRLPVNNADRLELGTVVVGK